MKTATKERGIMFSGPMIRALLEGRKTQTRRTKGLDAINTRPGDYRLRGVEDGLWYFANNLHSDGDTSAKCPYGQPGDRLWCKETLRVGDNGGLVYSADGAEVKDWPRIIGERPVSKTLPPIFMPRWASRLTLEITDVRVERLQSISEEDARAEGTGPDMVCSPEYAARHGFEGTEHDFIFRYRCVWNSINGKKHPWESNPWVWAITFKKAAVEAR